MNISIIRQISMGALGQYWTLFAGAALLSIAACNGQVDQAATDTQAEALTLNCGGSVTLQANGKGLAGKDFIIYSCPTAGPCNPPRTTDLQTQCDNSIVATEARDDASGQAMTSCENREPAQCASFSCQGACPTKSCFPPPCTGSADVNCTLSGLSPDPMNPGRSIIACGCVATATASASWGASCGTGPGTGKTDTSTDTGTDTDTGSGTPSGSGT